MRQAIKINKGSGLAYISDAMRKEGYVGEVECLPNAITVTLIRPGSALIDVKRSLQNVIKDIDLRIEYEQRENEEKQGGK